MINMGKDLRRACIVVLTVILAAAFSPGLSAKDKLPEVSHDGLHLQKDTKMAAVYLKPGASLDQYDRIALLACFVSFKKNWQRDYNRDVVDLDRRISTKDMDRIKKEVAGEFKKVFTKELETEGGYAIVDNAAEDVLVQAALDRGILRIAEDNAETALRQFLLGLGYERVVFETVFSP